MLKRVIWIEFLLEEGNNSTLDAMQFLKTVPYVIGYTVRYTGYDSIARQSQGSSEHESWGKVNRRRISGRSVLFRTHQALVSLHLL